MATIGAGNLGQGDHSLPVNPKSLGLPVSNYVVYQLQVANSYGTFRQCKMMTAAR